MSFLEDARAGKPAVQVPYSTLTLSLFLIEVS